MTKRFFTSLLLGFGGTLAVLVAISMPPGGWSMAVGIALGLLAALPLFLVVMALVKRQPSIASHNERYQGSQTAPSAPIIQQQLPQARSMPLPPNVNTYNYAAYQEQYLDYADFYEPQYVAETLADPRLFRGSKRRPTPDFVPIQKSRRQPAQNYYEDYEQAAYQAYHYPVQNQVQMQYENWNNGAGYTAYDAYDYYQNEEVLGEMIAPPDLAYYEEQQLRQRHQTPRYNIRPSSQSESNRAYRDFEPDELGQIVEAEYRELDGYDENL